MTTYPADFGAAPVEASLTVLSSFSFALLFLLLIPALALVWLRNGRRAALRR